ncbi:hypothetical protein B0T16DRAFT_156556 [Cercophora newfieldiana]|uniref:Uncharacterized protein n=1 Tax=Cercophora newfieldiana TaxID=92897 RepID=A0AA39Y552_9PEZI|nr:hypothetical protein B0T16DRAFT_156556 [Cercophora newfieldiana]
MMLLSTLLWAFAATPSLAAAIQARGAFQPKGLLEKSWMASNVKLMAALDFKPFELTDVRLECDADPDMFTQSNYTCGVTFQWLDPNSVKWNNVSSGSCNGSWNWWWGTQIGGDDNPLDVPYTACWQDERTYFAMRLITFIDPGNFTLQLAHNYRDPENFTEPYDYPTTFAQPTFTLPLIDGEWRSIIRLDHGPILTDVIGLAN